MARRYTPEELLTLRSSLPTVQFLVNKLNRHPDIACICRVPHQALQQRQFSCRSKDLADITNKIRMRYSSSRLAGGSDDSEYGHAPRQFQWNLRRRDSSDRSSQPHSAPTGLAQQQAENFQRFYRAVISPTHVRVTAGGRIVPNTRAVAPPALEWTESIQRAENQVPFGNSPSISRYTVPPQGDTFAVETMASETQPCLASIEHSIQNHNLTHTQNEEADRLLHPNGPQQQVRISPPNQFDNTKPFMYNGHVVYPLPSGFQHPVSNIPMPITMLGNPNFLQHPLPGPPGFIQPQFPVQLPNFPSSMFPASQQQFPMMVPSAIHTSENALPIGSYLPVPNGLSMCDILRTQIQNFRSNIMFIDQQLANKLIDETFAEQQRAHYVSQISAADSMIEFTLAQQGLPKEGPSLTTNSRGFTEPYRHPLTVSSAENGSAKKHLKIEKLESRLEPSDLKSSLHSETTSKSRLTIAAALAPPFQPRSQSKIAQASTMNPAKTQNIPIIPGAHPTPLEFQRQTEHRLPSKSSSDSGRSGAFGQASKAQTYSQATIQTYQSAAPMRSNTFHGQSVNVDSPQPVPYLIGVLPHGVSASQAKRGDLTYSRKLTEEEERARHLYWGNAPRSVLKGLPKFDGKDFYPPSPVKGYNHLAPTTPEPDVSLIQTRSPARLTNFEDLFTEPGVPGYKTPSPARPQRDFHSLGYVAESVFEKGSGGPVMPFVGGDHPADDFSHLFLEPGVPGYKPPSPDLNLRRYGERENDPVTPKNSHFSPEDEDASTKPVTRHLGDVLESSSPNSSMNEAASTTSTVEITLSPRGKTSPDSLRKNSFAERVANLSSEQHTLFLQNMLRNVAQGPMVGLALSGTVSSATAQGYLPAYSGSAAASLAPAMHSNPGSERGIGPIMSSEW